MLTEIQQRLVTVLEDARTWAEETPPAEGRLAPVVVRAYGGELLEANRPKLIRILPAVLVELEPGDLEAEDLRATLLSGDLAFDVICAAHNRASGTAQWSDGVALVTWAIETLSGAQLNVTLPDGTQRRVHLRRIQIQPLLREGDAWATALTCFLSAI